MEKFREFDLKKNTIFAPEGFIDKKYEPLLKRDNVRVIEVRYLADGLVFHTIQHHTMHP